MYTLYKTTNSINGKYYVGVSNGNDKWYKGSGTALKCAIKKYGGKLFTTEILEEFDNADAAFTREAEIVNEAFVADHRNYNIKFGGWGGKGQKKSLEHSRKVSKTVKQRHAEGRYKNVKNGRRPAMDSAVLFKAVKQYGITGAAKELNLTYYQCRDRYYRAKAKE